MVILKFLIFTKKEKKTNFLINVRLKLIFIIYIYKYIVIYQSIKILSFFKNKKEI